jgi:putative ABC transport system permease protein
VVLGLGVLWWGYRRWLTVHWRQELWAAFGIAVGVALVFSVQIANGSVTVSARQVLEGITGRASLQIAARDPAGFDEALFARVMALGGVARAAPLLEQRAVVVYRGRRVSVDLVGIDRRLPSLGGVATSSYLLAPLFSGHRMILPRAMADGLRLPHTATGSGPTQRVSVEVRGRSAPTVVSWVADEGTIGRLADAMLAAASLSDVQALTGLRGRITRILVVPRPGRTQEVRAALDRLAGGRLKVSTLDDELRLLEQASSPNDQATNLFAVISMFVGGLFAFNAMLLTMPERRQVVADLRIQGWRRAQLVQALGFQALVLGLLASVIGLGGGYALALVTSHSPPGYLALAFPLGLQRVVTRDAVLVAFAAGMIATTVAAAQPLGDLRGRNAVDRAYVEQDSTPGNALDPRARRWMASLAVVLVTSTSLLLLAMPATTIAGVIALAVATVLALPMMFMGALRLAEPAAGRSGVLSIATRALRATTLRSLALAATGAVAIVGSVAIEAAHQNLLKGLYRDYREYVSSADIWVANRGDDLALEPFDDHGISRRVRAVAGVESVRSYYGGLLDLGDRRTWIIARSTDDRPLIPPSQIIHGNLATATARLSAGGWVTVSQQLAAARHLAVGQMIQLPTPTGTVAYRIAATTTNLGWGPGAIVLSSNDYRHAWASDAPSALEVTLAPDADPLATKRKIERALGPDVALQVQTTAERAEHANALARAGLARLSQISHLLLIAAALAMAAAMGTAIWQRRATLAQLRVQGWLPPSIWRTLLAEATLVLACGCFAGLLAGTWGHFLLDRWLQLTTGYPAPFQLAAARALGTCAVVIVAALTIIAIIGWAASRAPHQLATKDPG